MAKTTVKDLAADLNLPVETLLSQLKEAGLSQSTPADELSEADKDRFLTSLQVARGSSNAGRRKITLTKREKSVITQNGGGSSHAVQVEVRRKRVLVKNPDVVNKAREEAKKAMEEQKEKARRLAEEAAARAKEEAERKAKEEAERAAKLKAEQEKAKAEEAARRQKAEAERSIEKAKAEAEAAARAAKEAKEAAVKAEADRDAARRAAEAEARAIREMMSAPKKVLTAKKPAQEEKPQEQKKVHKNSVKKENKGTKNNAKNADNWGDENQKRRTLKTRGGDNSSEESSGWKNDRRNKRGNKHQNQNNKGQGGRPQTPAVQEPVVKDIEVPETITVADLAMKMSVKAIEVIKQMMKLGQMVTINQMLDQETAMIVVEEMGHRAIAAKAEDPEAFLAEEEAKALANYPKEPRPPVVTIMGHVDHGKTSLLDYIRKANVIAGEAGGITQHIGAYNVQLEDGRRITFLDTPGHEAFTAMRARGAKVTDIAIIIVAADDNVMPQTKEAINHAMAAGVPIVFAINKVDKPTANPDKIKEELAAMNYLVEEWGGKYQSQDISAKKGMGVEDLLEKVLLEAEMLDLKANPNRNATGSIIESSLDKGRGYVATVLVSNGTLKVGDIVLAGTSYGRVKAMFNERNQRVKEAGPSEPALILGLNGAPAAGDTFHVVESDQEAREITNKREQLAREQGLRTQKILTLDELGRRIALGNFQELNIIVKGDVDGSVEALSDSLIKLSTEQIQVNVIHKGVGAISESDVSLAAASDAIIVGFQVRPSGAAGKMADQEGVDIRKYSVIYDAIEEVKAAMEGMLAPEVKEQITATIEIREVFNITKVGLVAGAMVKTGKVKRSDKARLIRDGIVIFTGNINALKRFKDDVKEVGTNFECGISLVNCNDMKVGDMIETFEEIEVKQTL